MDKNNRKHCSYTDLQEGWKNITYSVFDTVRDPSNKDDGLPYGDSWIVTNNLDDVAVIGECLIKADAGWNDEGRDYYSIGTVHNPTWRTLAQHADLSVDVTRDRHHIFFEGISVVERPEDGTKLVTLEFGS